MKYPQILHNLYSKIRFLSYKLIPRLTLKFEFKRRTGYSLNLKNPETYNEKLQWLKLNWRDPKATICADKYAVRKYVKDKGLGHILNDLYGVYKDVDKIDFDSLPDQFVMKVTHGCGQNLICYDKSNVEWNKEKKKFKNWMNESHYSQSLEWVYKNIKPRIIVERIIETEQGKVPIDYKVFCFNGKPKYIFIAKDRGSNKETKFDFYDTEWNYLDIKNHYPTSGEVEDKPKKLNKMLKYSEILSEGFPHVRVDFYIEKGKIIFGECTFFHMAGMTRFEPMEFDYKLGNYLKLPNNRD